jgi:hypothetical protein
MQAAEQILLSGSFLPFWCPSCCVSAADVNRVWLTAAATAATVEPRRISLDPLSAFRTTKPSWFGRHQNDFDARARAKRRFSPDSSRCIEQNMGVSVSWFVVRSRCQPCCIGRNDPAGPFGHASLGSLKKNQFDRVLQLT